MSVTKFTLRPQITETFTIRLKAGARTWSPGDGQDYVKLNLDADHSVAQGEMAWNADEETADLGLNGAVLQIGLEELYHAQNDTGSNMHDGQAVMFGESVGASGRGRIILTDVSDPASVHLHLGIVTESIDNGDTGKATNFGRVRGVNASGGVDPSGKPKLCFAVETWNDGDVLYLDPDHAGYLTKTRPTTPKAAVVAAFVLSNNRTNGVLFVPTTRIDLCTAWGDRKNGNYSEFESDGTLKFNGTATVFKDQLGPLLGQKLESPSSHIIANNAEGSLTFKNNCDKDDDFVVMNVQINHFWKEGSNVMPHFHWWQTTASVPNWLLQYRWQVQGAEKTSAWTSLAYDSHTFTYAGETALDQITSFVAIAPPAGAGISDVLQLRFTRDVTNETGLFSGAEAALGSYDAVSFDVHVECDTMGSRQEYAK